VFTACVIYFSLTLFAFDCVHVEQAVGGRLPPYVPRPCTPHAAAQLQPIHALRLACGAQRALLPEAVGAMNIHDVCNRRQTDDRHRQTRIIA